MTQNQPSINIISPRERNKISAKSNEEDGYSDLING